jgi:ankyrin repeat protein
VSPSPTPTTNLEQQRKRAKDLIRAARYGDPSALSRIRAVRSDAASAARPLRLSDAQLAMAREAGFESWSKLLLRLQELDVNAFREAVPAGDVRRVQTLVRSRYVRARINDPMFAFGQRATHVAAKNEAMLTVLIGAGADVQLKSDWENGPYTVLDNADEATARFLLERGATLTPNVAARLGWFEQLQALVESDGALVRARGGDGQQPLHEAKTAAIADFLLDHGADIDTPCIDHKSTPAQYALVDRPEVCRRLLERGARPDIFMAARLGDVSLATRLLDADADCVAARINTPGYSPVPLLHIYCWTLGFGMSPHDVASRFGHRDVHDVLMARSPLRVRFLNALAAVDNRAAIAMVDQNPSVMSSLTRHDHGYLAQAIFHGQFETAVLMLELGFDPAAPGPDGGTALHAACWMGNVSMVERILARGGVAVDARDSVHQSTPLGWAAYGSVHRQAAGADYPSIVDRLVAAGADIHAVANGEGLSLLASAQGNPAMQDALRRHGAV